MIPRINKIVPREKYILEVGFEDGKNVIYDLSDDIEQLPGYIDLKNITGLYESAQLDESRTCVFWNDYIDLPSDTIYEYGKVVGTVK